MVESDDLSLADLDGIVPRRQLDKDKALALREIAIRFTNQVQGGHVAHLSEIEGPAEDFALFLWAHLVTLRSGESGSESQSGGSVSYQRVPGDLEGNLTETRFGRFARSYLRGEQSYGIVKGRSHFGP